MKTAAFGFLLLLSSSFLNFTAPAGEKADDVLGTWLVGTKNARIEIFKTGKYYYGKIVWIQEPNDANGKPKKDVNNPDPALREKPLLNLLLLKGFEYDDNHEWENGTIYDSRSGKTYNCTMWFEGGKIDELKMRGYVGVSMLGKTDTWTRVK